MVDHESAGRAFDRAVVDVDVDDAEGSRVLRETPRRCRAETTFMYWSAGICPWISRDWKTRPARCSAAITPDRGWANGMVDGGYSPNSI